MFEKLVVIEKVYLNNDGLNKLKLYAKEVIIYKDIPDNDIEIISRISDADAILVSFTTNLTKEILEKCSNLKYIGMCCSLYDEKSASVDINYCKSHNIVVTGVRDYGDIGVREFVMFCALNLAEGYTSKPFWNDILELESLKVGIIGLGALGKTILEGFKGLKCQTYYYSRTRKYEFEKETKYLDLPMLLDECDIVVTSLSKNVILLDEEMLNILGNNKILFNVSLSPSFTLEGIKEWLKNDNVKLVVDNEMAIYPEVLKYENVYCAKRTTGITKNALARLTNSVLNNINDYLSK